MYNNSENFLIEIYGSREIVGFVESLDYGAISRAYKLINIWKGTNGAGNSEINAEFSSWLVSARNGREKDIALRMVFDDIMNAEMVANVLSGYGIEPEIKQPD